MRILLQRAHSHAKRHYEKHYKMRYQERAHFVFLLDTVLVAIALSLLALGCYFRWFYHPLRDDFKIALLTEAAITAGKETGFSVRITNAGERALRNATLDVHLPETFRPTALPEGGDAKTGVIPIGDVPAHGSLVYQYRGVLLGPAGAADVYLHVTAQNDKGKHDETLLKGTLRWTANAVDMRLHLPETVVPGQTSAFSLSVKNDSPFAFDHAVILPAWPEGFRLQNATPPVYRGKIALGRLEAGEAIDVRFSGRFSGAVDVLPFRAALRGDLDTQTLTIAEARVEVRMAAVDLELEAGFADGPPAFVRPGEEVPVIVHYRNDGAEPIRDLELGIVPDVNTLGEVRWETSNRITALEGGAEGTRKAFVRVRDAVSRYVVNPTFRVIPQGIFSLDTPKILGAQVRGTPAETKIAGSARLYVAARYYTNEGDQLGRGPLPPRVGKTTRYWMFANLETGATETRDGLVTFRLPENVAWTGRSAVTTGQDLTEENGRLIWRVGTTSPHAGLLHEAPSASFEIALTPTAAEIGTNPLLLSEAIFTGQDVWTDLTLSSSQDGLTTRLPNDTAVSGRGEVKP